jgi:hypothetical protein
MGLGAAAVGTAPVLADGTAEGVTHGPGLTPLEQLVEDANIEFGLLDSAVLILDVDTRPGVHQRIPFEIDGTPVTLNVWPHSVRSESYQVWAQVASGALVPVAPGPVRTVRGFVTEIPGTTVAGGVTDEGIAATIIHEDFSRVWVEPLVGRVPGAPPGAHVVYHDADVIPSGGTCGTEDGPSRPDDDDIDVVRDVDGGALAAGSIECAELAADADVEYFNRYGSIAAVESRINLVTNTMNPQYEMQTGITHAITVIIVRTAEPDPYSSLSSGSLLCQFITEWTNNQQDKPFDVAKLFTDKPILGGTIGRAANFGEICDRQGCCGCAGGGLDDGGFCFSESDCCGGLAWSTDLMAHELGHLWDAVHCDPCSTTMRSFIGAFNNFGAAAINRIVNHRNSRNCLEQDTCALQGLGACCLPSGSCLPNLTPAICASQGGEWTGEGVSCLDADCDGIDLGACCLPDFSCSGLSTAECAAQGGLFQGDGTLCGDVDCLDNDFCDQATLVNANSTSTIDNTDATPPRQDGGPGDPELPSGSPSCQWDGTPTDVHNTLWFEFVACDTSIEIQTCNSPAIDTIITLYSGSCGSLVELACGEDECGGAQDFMSRICYEGLVPGTTYTLMVGSPGSWSSSVPGLITLDLTCPCPDIGPGSGACCFEDGSCSVELPDTCTSLGGAYQGDGAACFPNPCPAPLGACCFPNDQCGQSTADGCAAVDGTYQGDGTVCEPTTCTGPVGACCFGDDCLALPGDDCAVFGGAYQGDGTTCDPDPCSDPPACPADLDGDQIVSLNDLLLVLAAWGPCPGCPEDLDDDDVVDLGDLLIVLAAWGACP